MSKNHKILLVGVFLVLNFSFADVQAQGVGFDARAGLYTKGGSDFFLGGGLKIDLLMVEVIPNIEYVFVDNATLYTLNLDGNFKFLSIPFVRAWVGGGIGTMRFKPEGFDTQGKALINILGGVGLNAIVLKPYAQIKYVFVKDLDNQFVVSVGIHL
jgi:hypothetical protein